MKLNKTLRMVPIVIGLGAGAYNYLPTDLSFNESDVKKNLIQINELDSYAVFGRNNLMSNKELARVRFQAFLAAWKRQTLFESNVSKIIDNKNFQSIISLGNSGIDFIIEELKVAPSPLVWALNLILNSRISTQNLTIQEASKKWITYWEQTTQTNVSEL